MRQLKVVVFVSLVTALGLAFPTLASATTLAFGVPQTIPYTGAGLGQHYATPANTCGVLVDALGAEGGAGYSGGTGGGTYTGMPGGAGGYVSALIPVSGVQNINSYDGEVGSTGTTSGGGAGGVAGGGNGGWDGIGGGGGGGGGYTLVNIQGGTTQVIAGAGGGGTSEWSLNSSIGWNYAGGAGAVGIGGSGSSGGAVDGVAGGGTQSGGGAGANSQGIGGNGGNGAGNQGGAASDAAGGSGGGGGGGFFGGGGGAYTASGGGGSNYVTSGAVASNAGTWTPPSQADGEVILTAEQCQTISPTSVTPSPALVGYSGFMPSATSTSSLSVTSSVDASATSVCSISGGVISYNAPGSCIIDMNQSGDASWAPAPQVQQSFTVTATVPSAPRSPSATATLLGASVSWSPPATNGGASLTGYSVQYSSDGGATWSASAGCTLVASSPCAVAGLTSGTSYLFEVDATNGVGSSAWSVPTALTSALGPPSAPLRLSVTQVGTVLSATWSAPATNGGYAVTYKCTMMFGFDVTSSFSQTVSGTTCVFHDAPASALMGVGVIAMNTVGQSTRAVGFPTAAIMKSILCIHAKTKKRVTGYAPVCPRGFHQKG